MARVLMAQNSGAVSLRTQSEHGMAHFGEGPNAIFKGSVVGDSRHMAHHYFGEGPNARFKGSVVGDSRHTHTHTHTDAPKFGHSAVFCQAKLAPTPSKTPPNTPIPVFGLPPSSAIEWRS